MADFRGGEVSGITIAPAIVPAQAAAVIGPSRSPILEHDLIVEGTDGGAAGGTVEHFYVALGKIAVAYHAFRKIPILIYMIFLDERKDEDHPTVAMISRTTSGGFLPGIAVAGKFRKIWRQSSAGWKMLVGVEILI